MILYLDTETYSETPLANGTHRYFDDPFAEIMIESWAIDDGEVQVADCTAGEEGPFAMFSPEDFDAIVIHQSDFDRIGYRKVRGIDIPVHLIHDTAVQARSHGLPGGLDKLCAIFRVPEGLAKHTEGRKLINLFCKPRPKSFKLHRATRHTHPAEWQEFLSYAGGDIHAMRYLRAKLPTWNYPNREHGLWCLDQEINDRGFRVDLDLARSAIDCIDQVKELTDAQTAVDTEGRVRSTTQRDALLAELLLQHGISLPDLTGTTIERRLEDPDLPDEVKELLGQRLMMSNTSTSKYRKVMDAVSEDGRLRNSLLFCGAPRTKRDSGRLFQPQNLPRPDMPSEAVEAGIEMMKTGLAAVMHPEPMRLAWNALRGLIIADPGKKLVQADLGQIEARVLPWLADEKWKLEAFKRYDAGTGPDLYIVGAARITGKKPEEIDGYTRQALGKVPELACGYGGAVGAFNIFAKLYNLDLPLHEVDSIVRAWREANPRIANWDDGLWVTLENAAREAINNTGRVVEAGEHIKFERWRNWLRMILPSGGFLSYADPRIQEHKFGGPNSITFMGINSYTRKWERLYTYGGKLSADATQATAREIFAHNWRHAQEEGFPIVLRVHDELVTEPVDDPNLSVHKLVAALTRRPPWLDERMPLAAGGFEAQRYRKD